MVLHLLETFSPGATVFFIVIIVNPRFLGTTPALIWPMGSMFSHAPSGGPPEKAFTIGENKNRKRIPQQNISNIKVNPVLNRTHS